MTTGQAWEALVHLARRAGFAVATADWGVGEGITTWRDHRIHIRPEAGSAQAVTALAHQLAHVMLHGEVARLESSGSVPCQGIRRVEAESVAYLVAEHLGVETPAIAFRDMSSWAGADPRSHPEVTVKAVSDRIRRIFSVITAYLDAEFGDERQPARHVRPAASPAGQLPMPADVPRDDLVRVHESAAQFFRDQITGSWVPDYLNGRGFGPAIQRQWQAGYAPARWDALTSALRSGGYPDTLIEAAGLARLSRRGTLIDTFRDRAMLPIHDAGGTIVAFIGRARPSASDVPKYLNSPHTSLYDKSSVLFGLWQGRGALANGAKPVITEGPFDAIAVSVAEPARYAGLAPCGTALTAGQIHALDEVAGVREAGVLVAFDPDEAGRRAAVKAYHLLSPLTHRAEGVVFPEGHDPAQTLNDYSRSALADVLAARVRPLADLAIEAEVARWDRWLQHIEGQFHALRAAAPLIAALPPEQVGRQITRLARRLGLDYPTVTEAVTDALTELVQAGHLKPGNGGGPADRSAQTSACPAKARVSSDFPHTARAATARAAQRPPTRGSRRTSADQRPSIRRPVSR
jgi:DNA primase